MPYPAYTFPERVADGTVHLIGIVASIVAVAVLLSLTAGRMSAGTLTATVVYSVTLIAMLGASGAYHLAAHTRARPWLRRIDHAAIYLKIAGTFTPLAVLIGSAFGYVVLGLVWAVALIGAARKLAAPLGRMTTGALPFILLGWIGVMLLIPLMRIAPLPALVLIAIGGLTYTAGTLFYSAERIPFSNAIWHGFVLVASTCFFAAIATSVTALP